MNRRVQIRDDDREWIDIDMKDLKEFDLFRVLNESGEEIIDRKGRKFFMAAGIAYDKFGDIVINVY